MAGLKLAQFQIAGDPALRCRAVDQLQAFGASAPEPEVSAGGTFWKSPCMLWLVSQWTRNARIATATGDESYYRDCEVER